MRSGDDIIIRKQETTEDGNIVVELIEDEAILELSPIT